MSCKHKALKSTAPKRKFCGSASNTKADSEGKGLLETAIWVTPHAISINFAWLWRSPKWFKFQKFSGGACKPADPLQRCVLYRQLRSTRAAPTPTLYVCPPFFNLWIWHWHLAIPPSSNGHLEGHQWHDPHKYFVEMLGVWLKRIHPLPTWSCHHRCCGVSRGGTTWEETQRKVSTLNYYNNALLE